MSPLVEQVQQTPILPGSLALWGLGQMGVIVKGPDAVLYIDPYLSDSVREAAGEVGRRAFDPPLRPAAVTNADLVLITHEHLDHLDPDTLGPLADASPRARFVAPGWCAHLLADLEIPDNRVVFPPALTPITLPGTDLRLTAVPSAHYANEYDEVRGYRWVGYLIEWNGVVLYHAGDTIIYPGYIETLKALRTPDVAMVPVNGRDYFRETDHHLIGNLLPVEAARLASGLGWDVLIPAHNDMFASNRIPASQIVDALETVAPRQKFKLLQPGELYYYVKPHHALPGKDTDRH